MLTCGYNLRAGTIQGRVQLISFGHDSCNWTIECWATPTKIIVHAHGVGTIQGQGLFQRQMTNAGTIQGWEEFEEIRYVEHIPPTRTLYLHCVYGHMSLASTGASCMQYIHLTISTKQVVCTSSSLHNRYGQWAWLWWPMEGCYLWHPWAVLNYLKHTWLIRYT